MARPIRIQYPGAVCHVMARGNQGREVFRHNRDRTTFLASLGEACARTGWQIHGCVLLANHSPLLVQTPEPNREKLAGTSNAESRCNASKVS